MFLINATCFLLMAIQGSEPDAKPDRKYLLCTIVLVALALVLVIVFVSILFIPHESPAPNFSPSNSPALPNLAFLQKLVI
jgi:hypothetical protein